MALSRRGLIGLMALAISVGGAPALAQAPAQTPAAAPVDVMAPVVGDRSIGRDDAPVTVVEYASFTCSHCAAWWTEVYPEFKSRFIDTGRARLVVRDLPTAPIQASYPAAILARCVAPDRFHDVATSLLTGRLALQSMADVDPWLTRAAEVGGMTPEQVETCMTDADNGATLDARIAAARAAGVTGTPAFFVDGARLADSDLATFDAAITAATPEPGAP